MLPLATNGQHRKGKSIAALVLVDITILLVPAVGGSVMIIGEELVEYLSFSSSSRQRSWLSLPTAGIPLLLKAALVWGPPPAPPGAPEPEAGLEVEEGIAGRVLCLKPADSRLISGRSTQMLHYITCVCVWERVWGRRQREERGQRRSVFALLTLQSLNEFKLRPRCLSRLFFYGALQLLQHFLINKLQPSLTSQSLRHTCCF